MSNSIHESTIIIVDLAYGEGREFGSKVRPAFVLKYANKIISCYKITSRFADKSQYFQDKYFEIKDWAFANLREPSRIDTVKIHEVNEEEVKISRIGYLSDKDEKRLTDFLTAKKE